MSSVGSPPPAAHPACLYVRALRLTSDRYADTVDNMDQTQKQVQHNPGPFDSSLYHRNNGAQRYAPVDAYKSHDDQGYRHHSEERLASFIFGFTMCGSTDSV